MHIKQITISGFKSYRDATIAGPFSPGHNVVVGRNGSGKSNFFDAVRFVLSDTFSSLRAEERVALLHEGAGASVLSAYVEMVFDNTDGRLPSDRDEVALRRMVGLKKDEYVLDRKNVTRTEVFNLLESAGFSRSNPYYIVQQGKVSALCAMTDRQRLELLKEVAGTRVYDERREESLKIMENTDERRQEISDVISYMESRLSELESEKDELKEYQRLDKERKALQYTIHVRELEEAKAALDALDEDRGHQSSKANDLNARLIEIRSNLATAERDVSSLSPELKRAEDEHEALDARRKGAIDKVAKLQVEVADAEQAAASAKEVVENTMLELDELRKAIAEKKEELEPLEGEFKTLAQDEKACRARITEIERKLLSLRVKADRVNQFSSQGARDAHIRKNVRESKKRKTSFMNQIKKSREEVERLEKAVDRNEAKLKSKEEQLKTLEPDKERASSEVTALMREREKIHEKRQHLWREDKELDAKERELRSGLGKLEARKRAAVGSMVYEATKFVMETSRRDPHTFGPNRVYGPLLELIDVDSKYSTAADVMGASNLLHVVVDSDETAARMVQRMQENRGGRLTFIPLNRLRVDSRPPPPHSQDSIPLVSKINCDPHFKDVVKHVYGRTLVARTLPIASELSKQYGVDCVTLDGDNVNRRGGISGGFVDTSRNKLDAVRFLRSAQAELDSIVPRKEQLEASLRSIDDEMSKVCGEIHRREAFVRTASNNYNRYEREVVELQNYITSDRDRIPIARNRISSAEESIESTNRGIADLERELATPMTSALSGEEESLMIELKHERDELAQENSEKAQRRGTVEKAVVSLRAELNDNLEKRQIELKRRLSDVAEGSRMTTDVDKREREKVERSRSALNSAEADLSIIKDQLKECEVNLAEKRKKHEKLNVQIEHNREEEGKLNKALEEDRQLVEKRYANRAIETQRKADAEKNIRELGSLPADFDKFRGLSLNALMRKLNKANLGLQKFAHVNKKALAQYMNFSQEREKLTNRREELDAGAASIRSLIESLDQRKDEDIMRTYKGVSKYFSEVFKELVPGGRANLVMMKSNSDSRSKRGRGDDSLSRMQYTGVAMKVAFSSTGEAYLLQQLSGGQKSIVALALIFAIQRLDPAPFYLFDEIDANLDATHRQAVANLIRKQANSGTQFVTTTFRPEFVNAGDMWYGVTHKKKVSGIQEVGRDVALTFITDDPSRR